MMNHIDQRLKAEIRYCHIPESGILLIVKRSIAFGQSFLDIRWHQEGRPITQMGIKLRKIDMNSCQIEIAEMNVTIGNAEKP